MCLHAIIMFVCTMLIYRQKEEGDPETTTISNLGQLQRDYLLQQLSPSTVNLHLLNLVHLLKQLLLHQFCHPLQYYHLLQSLSLSGFSDDGVLPHLSPKVNQSKPTVLQLMYMCIIITVHIFFLQTIHVNHECQVNQVK